MDSDLKTFKLDIDELLEEFIECNYTTMADMKSIWLSRKCSYIFEAKPSAQEGFFMQSLYSYAITDLKSLRMLVVDAKKKGLGVVPALVKRMIVTGMFLFGSVDVAGGNVSQKLDEVMRNESKRLHIAYEELLGGTPIDDYLGMNLGMDLEIDKLKMMSKEYSVVKEVAMSEASDSIGIEDVKPIMDTNTPIGDKVDNIVKEWDEQMERFYKQTGISHGEEKRWLTNSMI